MSEQEFAENDSARRFAKGFVLFSTANGHKEQYPVLNKWSSSRIGQLTLACHPDLVQSSAEHSGKKVVILGICCDPVAHQSSSEIAEALCSIADTIDSAVLEKIDQLSGRFVILLSNADGVFIFPDACATKSVFFVADPTSIVVCASHPSLVAMICGYEADVEVLRFWNSAEYGSEPPTTRYFPGMRTAFTGVSLLTPNVFMNARTRSLTRFFPRTPRIEETNLETVAAEVTNILRAQLDLLGQSRTIVVSLTAGLDSRVTLASLKGRTNFETFTYSFGENQTAHVLRDVLLAEDIARRVNVNHRVVECVWPVSSHLTVSYNDFAALADECLGIQHTEVLPQFSFSQQFGPNTLHLRSNISEVGRVFYKQFRKEKLYAEDLAHKFSRSVGGSQFVQLAFSHWMDVVGFPTVEDFGYDKYDLFYWEHRVGAWFAPQLLISDLTHDCVVPFNNRRVLERLLALPFSNRNDNSAFYHMLQNIFPELMLFPVNPPYSWAEARRNEYMSRRHSRQA